MWNGDRYVWRAGYWTRVRPGYVYVPSHYRWSPYGYVFVAGYWDLAVSRRGVIYAPIYVNTVVVGPRYVYTPYYAVRDTIVMDTLFVRPAFGVYYFGDYYGPRYVSIGFEPGVVYARRSYEPIYVYARWEHRGDPRWFDARVTLAADRAAGRAPVPPRVVNVTNVTNVTNITNVTNVTNINNVVGSTKSVAAAQGQKTIALDHATRAHVRQTSMATHLALAADRRKVEATPHSGPMTAPRTSALSVPDTPSLGAKTGATGTTGTNPPLTKTDTGKGTPSLDKSPPLRDATAGKGAPSLDKSPPPHRDPSKGRPFDPKKSSDDKKKK
jgi:hypothetical protein